MFNVNYYMVQYTQKKCDTLVKWPFKQVLLYIEVHYVFNCDTLVKVT